MEDDDAMDDAKPSKLGETDRASYEDQVHVTALSAVVGRHEADDARLSSSCQYFRPRL